MQRFESARRLQFVFGIVQDSESAPSSHQKIFRTKRNRNHFMPKQLLHGGQINAPHDQMRGGKGMPQVMEAKFSILAALHAFLKAS
jgi:hypothetical protein